jgi:hypothetical protein
VESFYNTNPGVVPGALYQMAIITQARIDTEFVGCTMPRSGALLQGNSLLHEDGPLFNEAAFIEMQLNYDNVSQIPQPFRRMRSWYHDSKNALISFVEGSTHKLSSLWPGIAEHLNSQKHSLPESKLIIRGAEPSGREEKTSSSFHRRLMRREAHVDGQAHPEEPRAPAEPSRPRQHPKRSPSALLSVDSSTALTEAFQLKGNATGDVANLVNPQHVLQAQDVATEAVCTGYFAAIKILQGAMMLEESADRMLGSFMAVMVMAKLGPGTLAVLDGLSRAVSAVAELLPDATAPGYLLIGATVACLPQFLFVLASVTQLSGIPQIAFVCVCLALVMMMQGHKGKAMIKSSTGKSQKKRFKQVEQQVKRYKKCAVGAMVVWIAYEILGNNLIPRLKVQAQLQGSPTDAVITVLGLVCSFICKRMLTKVAFTDLLMTCVFDAADDIIDGCTKNGEVDKETVELLKRWQKLDPPHRKKKKKEKNNKKEKKDKDKEKKEKEWDDEYYAVHHQPGMDPYYDNWKSGVEAAKSVPGPGRTMHPQGSVPGMMTAQTTGGKGKGKGKARSKGGMDAPSSAQRGYFGSAYGN